MSNWNPVRFPKIILVRRVTFEICDSNATENSEFSQCFFWFSFYIRNNKTCVEFSNNFTRMEDLRDWYRLSELINSRTFFNRMMNFRTNSYLLIGFDLCCVWGNMEKFRCGPLKATVEQLFRTIHSRARETRDSCMISEISHARGIVFGRERSMRFANLIGETVRRASPHRSPSCPFSENDHGPDSSAYAARSRPTSGHDNKSFL